MKLFGQPDAAQAGKYEQFVDAVVWGNLQYQSGAQKYGVKRTLFYYEPSMLPAGYYSSADEYPKVIHPYSNEREMVTQALLELREGWPLGPGAPLVTEQLSGGPLDPRGNALKELRARRR